MDDAERTARRYQLASSTVEYVALAAIVSMTVVLTAGSGTWVGEVALRLLAAAVVSCLLAWRLQRHAAAVRAGRGDEVREGNHD